ncbi:uncharacterized protein LOC6556488 [Drosophila grimshawi]|uniref:GH16516 n=1 Tax=Drosophila grimshawi TaxID=7222 RepID=B4J125_DROGR|nr:uncharacterized protein LOC6556488 [Drosophila grimshawi]XP_032598886.1 uncharacterized protein LOC6556488 [Drosophila grimshawi]EDV96880.1 GH16516 [Drosophila grimshawi]
MYAQSRGIKDFDSLKTWALWAGSLGVVQAIIWIGLTITAIIAYTCHIYIAQYMTYGTYVKTIFFDVYFHGNCKMAVDDYENYNSTMVDSVQTVFDPTQLLIWDCVYLGVSVCWLIVSIVLLLGLRKDNVSQTLGVIYSWAFFVAAICAMDVTAGVIFGVDYGRFHDKASQYNANNINIGAVDPNAAQLVAGGVAAMAMMIIAFKGFILLFINLLLLIGLIVRAVRIGLDKDGSDTLYMPRKDSNDILSTRQPIRAYETEKIEVKSYNNGAFMPDTRSTTETIEVNEEAIVRAAHMSRDANLLERRFRNLDAFQQYPEPNQGNRPVRQSSQGPMQETIVVATAGFPVPDYSPQPSPNPNGILRHHQY